MDRRDHAVDRESFARWRRSRVQRVLSPSETRLDRGRNASVGQAMPVQMSSDLRSVYAFWNSGACNAHLVEKRGSERESFAAYREFRYRTEWQIPAFAGFADARGKRVLEIGCGNGADAVMFAKHGAAYVGV